GITFKENCPDIRNTKVIDVYRELITYGLNVDIYDPLASEDEVKLKYNLELLKSLEGKQYDGIILAVAHKTFFDLDINVLRSKNCVVFDLKACLNRNSVDARL